MSKTMFSYSTHDYWLHDTGYIECQDHNEYWCDDIELLIVTQADAGTIWQDPEAGGAFFTQQSVQVPIRPTAAQWAFCLLEYSDKLFAYKVTLMNAPFEAGTPFIGFINEPEARWVLRSMIVDWFRGNVQTDGLECTMTSHSFDAQMRWESDMKKEATAFGQYWSVWTTNKCLGCTGPSDDFGDLIPEEDKKQSPWSK